MAIPLLLGVGAAGAAGTTVAAGGRAHFVPVDEQELHQAQPVHTSGGGAGGDDQSPRRAFVE